MWQRIQTLYLAVSAVLMTVLLFGDAFSYNEAGGIEYVRYLQLQKPWFGILLGILSVLIVLALVSLGAEAWLGYLYFTAPEGIVFRWTAIFPFVIAVLNLLAARGCYQDQLMVEAAYHIRNRRRR